MKESKSILAKLLANENITIKYGNYETAWFDPTNRVLGLPVLNESYSQDVADLFIGHEVGHALETPAEGWHQSPIEFDVPRSFLNVCEDIRIERKVQNKYPGLKGSFKRGYKELLNDNFFNTSGRDLSAYSLIDRLNLKSKLNDLIDIQFSAEELPYVKAAYAAETWDEVVIAAKNIFDFMRSEYEKEKEKDTSNEIGDDLEDGSENESYESSSSESEESAEEPKGESEGESTEEPKGESESESESESKESAEEPKGESKDESEKYSNGSPNKPLEAETDIAFRDNENKLVITNGDKYHMHINPFKSNSRIRDIIIKYDDIKKSRDDNKDRLLNEYPDYIYNNLNESFINSYPNFLNETKRFVSVLSKEFEMRKSAYRNLRAKTSDSGSLNVNKLYSYKYNDEIFKRVTTLADSKSHGMIMFIDYSGSMGNVMGEVIKQALVLAEFCKRVNIPFAVYGFTSNTFAGNRVKDMNLCFPEDTVSVKSLNILELLNSDMKTSVYKEAYAGLYKASIFKHASSQAETLGSTPLIETLFVAEHIVNDFRKKHNVQKTNLILLTDGMPSSFYQNDNQYRYFSTYTAILNNKKLNAKSAESLYKQAVASFSSDSVNVIGFFLAERRSHLNPLIINNIGIKKSDYFKVESEAGKLWSEITQSKFAIRDNFVGYDRMFILRSSNKNLSVDNDELDINEDASKAQIVKAFKKYSSSKKTNKVLASKFAQIIS